MRKIEREMVQAIKDRRNWKSSNTEVLMDVDNSFASVYLHGNHIAEYQYNTEELVITNAGWRTVTTKSRLNALINEFLDGTKNGVYQKNHRWYVIDHGRCYDFNSDAWYSFKSNALDVSHTVTNSELIAV
tara:strand:+ start:928 stop:1317 length:390 start_codon:yes stop_codon:yes gene_type:complete